MVRFCFLQDECQHKCGACLCCPTLSLFLPERGEKKPICITWIHKIIPYSMSTHLDNYLVICFMKQNHNKNFHYSYTCSKEFFLLKQKPF